MILSAKLPNSRRLKLLLNDEIPNAYLLHNYPLEIMCYWGRNLNKIQSISRKLSVKSLKSDKSSHFCFKFRQNGNFLGIRIVRIFGQKYSRFEYLKIFE